MKDLKTIWQLILPYKGLAFKNVIYNLFSAFFALFVLLLIGPFLSILFGEVQPVADPGPFIVKTSFFVDFKDYAKDYGTYWFSHYVEVHGAVNTLMMVVVVVIIASFMKNLLIFLANNCMASLRAYTVRDFRKKVYDKILRLPLSYFSEARKGDLMTRMSNDVGEIEISVMASITMLLRDPITIILFMVYLFIASPQLTLFALVLLPVSGIAIGRISRKLRSKSLKAQQQLGRLLSVLEETLTGLRVIKGFNGERKMQRQFGDANDKYARIHKRVARKNYLAHPVSEFLSTIVMVVILFYGGMLALNGNAKMSSVALITFVAVFSQIIQPAKSITTAWFNVQKGLASLERINFVLDADETIRDKENAVPLNRFDNSIEFRNVWFSYGQEPVLKNINLTVKKGQTVAIVGRSGGGKSTLVDLVPRFIDPQKGQVLIDGIDIRDVRLNDLHKFMGIVNQQAILFNDSFTNNISFAVNEADEASVMKAAGVANAHEFVMESAEGYETLVGEGGSKLSGGQRQRISIARAVMANPPILILDEATSALDTESEKLVQDAMEKLMVNRTSIVIAHRLSTIQHADLIVVIEEGQIVETGNHEELLKRENGIYAKLYKMQSF